jgi:carboxylesterase
VLIPITATVLALAAARAAVARRREGALARRLPLGADGIIPGAATIDLAGRGPHAAFMVHGFGDTPQTLALLAEYLHARGFSVRVPLLPGHGRTLPEFARSRADDWIGFARSELAAFRARHPDAAIVGLSMGGAVAAVLAAEAPAPPALALVAPYVSMPATVRRLARIHPLVGTVAPYVGARGGERSIHDPDAKTRSLAYGCCTPRLVAELASVVERGRRALPALRAPTLVVHSREDNRVPPEAAERTFALIGAPERRLVWTAEGGHILTVDHGRERIFALVEEWLAGHLAARGAAVAAG